MTTKTPSETLDKIRDTVREVLDEHFRGEYVFDPIVVLEKPDFWGDPHVCIYIAHKGPTKIIDPDFSIRLVGKVFARLPEDTLKTVPSKFFIPKSSWDRVYRAEIERWIPAA